MNKKKKQLMIGVFLALLVLFILLPTFTSFFSKDYTLNEFLIFFRLYALNSFFYIFISGLLLGSVLFMWYVIGFVKPTAASLRKSDWFAVIFSSFMLLVGGGFFLRYAHDHVSMLVSDVSSYVQHQTKTENIEFTQTIFNRSFLTPTYMTAKTVQGDTYTNYHLYRHLKEYTSYQLLYLPSSHYILEAKEMVNEKNVQ